MGSIWRIGGGLGKAVLLELEQFAASQGADRLHLLTQNAVNFFASSGYELLDTDKAPVAITQTAQFKHLCSSSASYLRKSLSASHCVKYPIESLLGHR